MSKAPGGGEGVHGQLVELSVVCSWVCFGKSTQIHVYFQLNRIKLFLSLNVKTSQQNEKPALKL